MSEQLERLRGRLAELGAERAQLLAAQTPPTKKELKARRDVSRDLATHEKRVDALAARLAKIANDHGKSGRAGAESEPFYALALRLWKRDPERMSLVLAAALLIGSASVAAVGILSGRDDVRWLETTCHTFETVDSDGDGYSVTIPAIRPDWRHAMSCGGRCWVMDPEISARRLRCEPPSSEKASRWEQVDSRFRLWISGLLLAAIAALWLGVRTDPD